MRKLKPIAAAIVLATTVGAAPAPKAQQAHNVTVTVQRLRALSNLDADFLRPDRADFYAEVSIDGRRTRTATVFGKDDIRPNWKFTQRTLNRYVVISIRAFDNDGGLEGTDDFCDLNPSKGARELSFVYDTATGRITGGATGRRGQPITVGGSGDGRKAEIVFVVNHN